MPSCSHGQPAEHMPEEMQNRVLRRADWRFLLSNPQPGLTACWANGLLAQSVAMVSDRVAPRETAPRATDLVVLVNPDQAKLRAAWDCLRDGGACYSEWYSPLVGGAPGVRRRLESAGFSAVACYWPWPPPPVASPLFWLPLQAPQALSCFLSNRPRSVSIVLRVWNALLRTVWRLARWAGVLVPVCAVARKSADARSQSSSAYEDLSQLLEAQWRAWGRGSTPHRLDRLLLTGGESRTNKIVEFVFADSEPTPCMVVKRARAPDSIPALKREAANLQALHAQYPAGISGVPRPLFFQNLAETPALGETCLLGQPLYGLLSPGTISHLARQITDWLVRLCEGAPICPRSDWWDRLVGQALQDFRRNFGDILEPAKLRETERLLASLGDMPLVWEQRDCSPWNVLVAHDGTLIVLDWESAEPRGLPALDLHYFLTHCALCLAGTMLSDRARATYRQALDPATPIGRVLAENERDYFARVGLDPRLIHPLRLLTWVIHSRSEYSRLVSRSSGRPDSAALRASRFVAFWEEELEHALACV